MNRRTLNETVTRKFNSKINKRFIAQGRKHCYNACITEINEGGNPLRTDFGKFFRETRKSLQCTQQDIAERLHVSPQAVSRWERSECLPDIALLPAIAAIFRVKIEELLEGDTREKGFLQEMKDFLHVFMDEPLFQKVAAECRAAGSIQDLPVSFEIFLFLNNRQREELLAILFELEDYATAVDEIFQYVNHAQRISIMNYFLEKGDYENLEPLIPFMDKSIRTKVLETLLTDESSAPQALSLLEEMLPFLNRQQKDLIMQSVIDQKQDPLVLENCVPFFDAKQRKIAEKIMEDCV